MVYALIYLFLGILTVEMVDYLAFGKVREALKNAGKDIYKKDGITIDEGEHFKVELIIKLVLFILWPIVFGFVVVSLVAIGGPKKMKKLIDDINIEDLNKQPKE